MNVIGPNHDATQAGNALRWSGKVVTAEDLRQSLNGERQLLVVPGTVITPSALDHLKAKGVSVVRGEASAKPPAMDGEKLRMRWGYWMERPDSVASNVIQVLKRDGVDLQEITHQWTSTTQTTEEREALACGLARQAAEVVAGGECRGGIVFCLDPGLTCCIANKVKGIRAAAIGSVRQVQRAAEGLGANLLALELGKSTFFEMRQMVRSLCNAPMVCHGSVARTLRELEGGCHCQQPEASAACERPGSDLPGSLLTPLAKCSCGGSHAHR
jgi:ribose 5-phosphate isomerase RpiB